MEEKQIIKYAPYAIAGVILLIDFIWLNIVNAEIAGWYTDTIYQQMLQSTEMMRNQLTALFWVGVAGIVSLIKVK